MAPILVEIWSDVVCPFCYIGKRQFEEALSQFSRKDDVQVQWKSYQLDPTSKTEPGKKALERLAAKYGWTLEQARQASQRVSTMAQNVGLTFDMENAQVINSFDAHRLTHLAKTHGKQIEAEEKLFSAHFCEAKSAADQETLVSLATSLGLAESEVREMLSSDAYADEVKQDLDQARQLGITGVPFFVFNRKLAVSGAQGPQVFLQALTQASQG